MARIRGVNYDVGIQFDEGYLSRPLFDPQVVRRELEIIKKDLRCTAVRISGTDPHRLMTAARQAVDLGLEVWVSPHLHDRTPQQTLEYTLQCAAATEALRQQRPDAEVVFVLGCELTLFMQGILKGNHWRQRIGSPLALARLKVFKTHNRPLNAFLAQASRAVRGVFTGRLTYASAPIEDVDWSLFDIVALDYYRAKQNRATYGQSLSRRFTYGKPVVVTEVGLCPYRGAEDKGARGFAIADFSTTPPRLTGDYIRDEALQAGELTDMLQILDHIGVDGTFVFTFVAPGLPHGDIPRHDLDLASYALVTSYTDHRGRTYPELPWEPKQAFHAVADFYART